jgi:hypothetical protein
LVQAYLVAGFSGETHQMSRIYDALKSAQRERASKQKRDSEAANERRHVRRFQLEVPVFVYGHADGNEPFHEEATATVVNANGALLAMASQVIPGQTLLLTNPATHAEQSCRVVHLRASQAKTAEVGVAFDVHAPEFWPLPAEPGVP